MNKTVVCILLIMLATFAGITLFKVENLPKDKSCVDLSCPTCAGGYNCSDYNAIEKIRYVWKLY